MKNLKKLWKTWNNSETEKLSLRLGKTARLRKTHYDKLSVKILEETHYDKLSVKILEETHSVKNLEEETHYEKLTV